MAGFFARGPLAGRRPASVGLATIGLLPVVTAADMLITHDERELFLLEWLIYAVFAIPAMVTAHLGQRLRRRMKWLG